MSQTLQIMEIGEQIAYLEDQLTKWKEDYICLENLKNYEIKQLQEHHKKVCGDFTFIHRTLEEKIKELQEENKKLKEELTEWNLIREDCETAFFRRDYLAMHKRVAKANKIIEKLLKYIFTPEGFEELDKDMIMEAKAFLKELS